MKKVSINQTMEPEQEGEPATNSGLKEKGGKKKSTFSSLENIINSPVTKTMARTGSGLANEGTAVSYEEER